MKKCPIFYTMSFVLMAKINAAKLQPKRALHIHKILISSHIIPPLSLFTQYLFFSVHTNRHLAHIRIRPPRLQGSVKKLALGCVNSPLTARGSQEVGITQPRETF